MKDWHPDFGPCYTPMEMLDKRIFTSKPKLVKFYGTTRSFDDKEIYLEY